MDVISKIGVTLILSVVLSTFATVSIGDMSSNTSAGETPNSDTGSTNKHKVFVSTQINNDMEQKWAWEGALISDALPKGMAKDEFVSVLKQRFYGSFILYRRLHAAEQESVYLAYQHFPEPNINDVRKVIVKLK